MVTDCPLSSGADRWIGHATGTGHAATCTFVAVVYPALVLAASQPWYAIGWVDVVSVVGLPLTLLGLTLAWWQARAASNYAKAAREAVEHTERRLRANQLLVLIPQLRWISAELDASIEANNAVLAKRQLDNWRWQASNVHGLLDVGEINERSLLQALQQSVGLAHAASGNLMMPENGPVLKRCARARASIGRVCDQLNVWVGQNVTRAMGEGNEG